ncbi:hypothetical protein ACMA1D_10640 [Streptomyces sp. 796.1]|uniref:hypothetical protein n=1 Tax=Streptomyces sp. 796.1 TaxID=3163029 RepID=UPI0039C92E08
MAWTAPMTAVPGSPLTAAQFNTYVRDNLLETEAAKANFTGNMLITTGANAITARNCFRSRTLTASTTSSTTYTGLDSGGGPTVTVTTGTTALVWVATWMENTAPSNATMASVSVSGATVVAASDTNMVAMQGLSASPPTPNSVRYGVTYRFTGLTPGVNTFTMEYRVSGGTGTFSNRELLVMAL